MYQEHSSASEPLPGLRTFLRDEHERGCWSLSNGERESLLIRSPLERDLYVEVNLSAGAAVWAKQSVAFGQLARLVRPV